MSRTPFAATDLRAALLARPTDGRGPIDPDTIRLVRAPGRVNLIGEHTDYNLGFVLPAAIDREVRMAVAPSPDRRVVMTRLESGETASFHLDEPRPRDGTWLDYIAGVAWALAQGGIPMTGLRGVIASDLPENAGLSSSAAIELAAAWALAGDAIASTDPLRVAQLCQRAENGYVGVMSGLMDQFASACGAEGRALLLDCRSLEWRPVPLPPSVRLVVLHSGSPRKLDGSAYNERRGQCEAAVAALARHHPDITSLRDVSPELLAAERDGLDPVVARRAEHVVAENERVGAAVAALERNDLETVGELFAASHRSLGELYEVTSPELDALVEIASGVPGVAAARMTGAGFGGCTVNLVEPHAVDDLAAAVTRQYGPRTGLTARIIPVHAAAGAGWLEPAEA